MEAIGMLGFWIFAIVAVVKWSDVKRAKAYSTQPQTKPEIEALKTRVATLEQEISQMTKQMIEIKDEHDFNRKLLDTKQLSSTRQ